MQKAFACAHHASLALTTHLKKSQWAIDKIGDLLFKVMPVTEESVAITLVEQLPIFGCSDFQLIWKEAAVSVRPNSSAQ